MMFLGNSRVILGKNLSDPGIGEWLAIAPSSASSGEYGINLGTGYSLEIFNGYLYVGGDISSIINNTTTTSGINNLIKINLNDSNSTWGNAISSNEGTVLSMRDALGDHLLIASANGLFYITDTSSNSYSTVSTSDPYLGLSNSFNSLQIYGDATYNATGGGKLFAVNSNLAQYDLYDSGSRTLLSVDPCYVTQDSIYSHYHDEKLLTLFFLTPAFLSSLNNKNTDCIGKVANNGIITSYDDKMWSSSNFNNNIIYVAGEVDNILNTYNLSLNRWDSITLNVNTGKTLTLGEVVYNNTNYLIIGGTKGIHLVNPTDLSVTKSLEFPGGENSKIYSVFVDSNSTIYITGSFSFVDKNGVTAKNIAKFKPSSSKIA